MTPDIEWIVTEPWGRLGFRNWSGRAFLHCQIDKWSPSHRRACLALWETFKAAMRKRGFCVLYSAVPSKDALVNKWQRMFGMKPISMSQGMTLYSQEI